MHPHIRQNTTLSGLSGGYNALFAAPHRFSFNGQEGDDEVSGEGNSLSFKYRVEDSRLGRFFSVDPLFRKYSYNSTYAFAENRVIDGRELEGLEVLLVGLQLGGNLFAGWTGETGLAFTPDGIYSYRSEGISLASNVGAGGAVSITYFGSMTSSEGVKGEAESYGMSGGEGLQVGINGVKTADDEGINMTFGIGVSVLPFQFQYTKTDTWIKPLKASGDIQLMESGLKAVKLAISKQELQVRRLQAENNDLTYENQKLKKSMEQSSNPDEKQKYLKQMKHNSATISSNNNMIGEMKNLLLIMKEALDKGNAKLKDMKTQTKTY